MHCGGQTLVTLYRPESSHVYTGKVLLIIVKVHAHIRIIKGKTCVLIVLWLEFKQAVWFVGSPTYFPTWAQKSYQELLPLLRILKQLWDLGGAHPGQLVFLMMFQHHMCPSFRPQRENVYKCDFIWVCRLVKIVKKINK